jgi:glycosyltransferase involved in cell wall biosynthesis
VSGAETAAHCLMINLDADCPDVDWASASLWRVIATTRGVPCWASWVISPGRLRDPVAFTEQLLAQARRRAAELALVAELERALGVVAAPAPVQTVSVVVCTHRRSAYLPGLLDALDALAPRPHEVVIVDNDPADEDCRDLVLAHGGRYVREDRRGLDHARATGMRAAGGTIVAYTDDDCLPSPTWLARVDKHFADHSVHAVTGPAFAYELISPSQVRFELEGGFSRGFTERRFDWMVSAPCNSGVVGAGANMLFRRSALIALGEVFPPELDAGTATQTGGDMYALYRVLESGFRIVYDPGTYVFHRHRGTPQALARAFRGYGTGIVATVSKLLVERHEPEALIAVRWLWRQYRDALTWSVLGQTDPRSLRVSAYYLLGGLSGVTAWHRARAELAVSPLPALTTVDGLSAPDAADAEPGGTWPGAVPAAGDVAVSVIVPTVGRGALRRCLDGLPGPSDRLEIIVVDDRPDGASGPSLEVTEGVRILRSGGMGAAAARNRGAAAASGDILIFLDDDFVPKRDLVARHRDAHGEDSNTFVIGFCDPWPAHDGWAARAAALWWLDHYRALSTRRRLVPTDILSGNVSMRRDRFTQLGGFSERLGRLRREDWLFGAAVLRAGMTVRFEARAAVRHEFTLTTAGRLAAAAGEGRGDALLCELEPGFAGALPAARLSSRRLPTGPIADLCCRPRARGGVVAALDVLERARMRGLWLAVFGVAQRALYVHGRRAGERALGARPTPTAPRLQSLTADSDSLEFDGLFAPDLVVTSRGTPQVIRSDLGRWTSAQARRAAHILADGAEQRTAPRTAPATPPAVALIADRPAVTPELARTCADRGVALHICDRASDRRSPWQLAHDASVSSRSPVEFVWVAMPFIELGTGVVDELVAGSDGDRVSVALATPARTGARWQQHRRLGYGRWLTVGDPPALVGFRSGAAARLGPLDLAAEDHGGIMAPGLELAERALRRGEVLGHVDLTSARRRHPRHRPWRGPEWQRQRARASLMVRPGAGQRPAVDALRALAVILRQGAPGHRRHRGRAVALAGFAHGATSSLMSRHPHRHAPD